MMNLKQSSNRRLFLCLLTCLVLVVLGQTNDDADADDIIMDADDSCHSILLLPLSPTEPFIPPEDIPSADYKGQYDLDNLRSEDAYSYLVSAVLALNHFNDRNTTVISELADLIPSDCNMHFGPPLVEDTSGSIFPSIQKFTKWYYNIASQPQEQAPQQQQQPPQSNSTITTTTTISNETTTTSKSTTRRKACALLGPIESQLITDVSKVSSSLGVPQMLMKGSTNPLDLANPFTVSTVISTQTRMLALASYLNTVIGRTHVFYLNNHNPYMAQRAHVFQKIAQEDQIINNHHQSNDIDEFIPLEVEGKMDSSHSPLETGDTTVSGMMNLLRQTLQSVKETGMTTIVLDYDSVVPIIRVARVLHELDMLTDDYLYVLPVEAVPTDTLQLQKLYGEQEIGSPLDLLLSGAIVMDPSLDGFRTNAPYDLFLKAWQNQDSTLVQQVNRLLPKEYQVNDDYFQTVQPSYGSSYVYDTIMTIGIGYCMIDEDNDKEMNSNYSTIDDNAINGSNPPPSTDGMPPPSMPPNGSGGEMMNGNQNPPPNGGNGTSLSQNKNGRPSAKKSAHIIGMQSSEFLGASGKVRFDKEQKSNSRDSYIMAVGLYNIRPDTKVNPKTGKRSYRSVLTSVWTEEAGWWKYSDDKFIYRSGTTNPPPSGKKFIDWNYLSSKVRALGLSLMAFSWFLSITAMILVAYLRKDPIIQRAQPFFLYLLCGGSVIMAASMLTLSLDEGSGHSPKQLNAACTATPWLFFIGQIMTFGVLFTKLWRLDKVLQLRRRVVTIRGVMGPLVGILMTTFTVLLVWTIVDPWTWVRDPPTGHPPESYGQCRSDNFAAYFGTLVGIMVVAQGLTVGFAIKTKDVPEDFRDSTAVLYASVAQLQSWVVGIPILAVLGESSADASYLGRVLLIWIMSISAVAVVIWPKISRALQLRRHPELVASKKDRVQVSGLTIPSSMVNQSMMSATSANAATQRGPAKYSGTDFFQESFTIGEDAPKESLGISESENRDERSLHKTESEHRA